MPYNENNREIKERMSSLKITYCDLAEVLHLSVHTIRKYLLTPFPDNSRRELVELGMERVLENPGRKTHTKCPTYPKQNIELRKRLKALNITHQDIASICKVHRKTVENWLNQEINYRVEKAIAQILNDRARSAKQSQH